MRELAPFAGNVTSQSGEDGILAEIFRRIGTAHRACVEFGAWDGRHLSNTWSLWHEQGWRGVLIEGHPERYLALARSLADFPQVSALCAYVQPEGANGLDDLLERCGIARDFDLLSIDVDGDDHPIWQGMTRFKPRVVVIEYNPTIPPEIELVQRRGGYFGASARALVSLAQAKGYRLACCTKTNCIFVAADCWDALGLGDVALEDIFPRGHLTYVINSYDGKTWLNRIPTYAYQLPPLTPGVLARELRASFAPDLASAQRPAEPGSPLSPVRIFAMPENPSQSGVAWRTLRYFWRAFVATPIGAPAGKLLEQWRHRRNAGVAIGAWEQQGRPVPPPHAYKQRVVREYARRYGLPVLVETGTYLGDMVEAARTGFRTVFSIELDRDLHRRAVQRFAARANVTILQGDSAQVLPQLLGNLEGPALFWLDGHYSADITARGDKDTPIVSELENISRHPVRQHVILIDDARCFNGTHDYPTLKELEQSARRYWPGSTFEVRDDIIRIAPAL